MIYVNFMGIMTKVSKRYFITFIDNCTDFTFIQLLKNKSDVLNAFKSFVCEIENQHDRKVKKLRSDRKIEYDLDNLYTSYNSHGIIHEKTTPYSPEMNDKAKRKNRTLVELVVAILLNSEAMSYWQGQIILIVCYVLNRILKSKNIT